jgi:hypothetical protein
MQLKNHLSFGTFVSQLSKNQYVYSIFYLILNKNQCKKYNLDNYKNN